jgi:hypothetical protein
MVLIHRPCGYGPHELPLLHFAKHTMCLTYNYTIIDAFERKHNILGSVNQSTLDKRI